MTIGIRLKPSIFSLADELNRKLFMSKNKEFELIAQSSSIDEIEIRLDLLGIGN